MRFITLAVAAAIALGAAPQASTQSLAEVAAKEKERRKGTTGKVITETDLRGAGQGGPSDVSEASSDGEGDTSAEGASSVDGAKAAPKEKTEEEKRAYRQAAYQKEISDELAHIEGLKKDIAAREVELKDLTNYTYGGRRADLLKFVDDANKAITDHESQIEKLRAQARNEGLAIR